MRLTITVDGAEVQWIKRSLTINTRMGTRISTTGLDILGEERWATPASSVARVVAIGGYILPHEKAEVIIDKTDTPLINCAVGRFVAMGGESSWLDRFFAGYMSSVERRIIGKIQGRRIYRITAQDYNALTTQILVTESYAAKTEQFMIDDLFTTYLPEIDTSTYVESSGSTYTFDWTRQYLDVVLNEIAKINEKEWYIDYNKKLHYFTPVTTSAPFALSSSPFGTTILPYGRFIYKEETSKLINRVIVVGDGGAIVRTRTDTDSFDFYGRYYESKYVDPNIDTNTWADLVGDAILAESAFRKVKGALTLFQEGLEVGQKVSIYNFLRGIDDYDLIQQIRLSMINSFQEQIAIQYGDYAEDLIDLLLKIPKGEQKE